MIGLAKSAPSTLVMSGTRFCTTTRIVPEATKLFQQLNQLDYFTNLTRSALIDRLSWLYGELNIVHPFREGNGRAQRILFEHIIVNCGFEISWNTVEQKEWIEANIASVGCNYDPLTAIFERCVGA